MFCILTPVLAIPILSTLTLAMRVRKTDVGYEAPPKRLKDTPKKTFIHLFWQLDFVGLFLFVAGAALVLLTITLANSRTARWSDGEYGMCMHPLLGMNGMLSMMLHLAHSIAMLIIGGLCCIAFVFWERSFAKHPLIPFNLLTNRTVVCSLLIALFHPMGGRIAGYVAVSKA